MHFIRVEDFIARIWCVYFFRRASCGCVQQGPTITFCIHWPGGPVDLKSYWPAKKVTGPNFFVGTHIYSDKNRYIVQ